LPAFAIGTLLKKDLVPEGRVRGPNAGKDGSLSGGDAMKAQIGKSTCKFVIVTFRFLFLFLFSAGMATCAPSKLVRVDQNQDGSLEYIFQNQRNCHKTADYTKYNKAEGTIKVKTILEAKYSSEEKFENAKRRNPKIEEVEAALFDICYEYGEERLTEEEYKSARTIYDKIRQLKVAEAETRTDVPREMASTHVGMVPIPGGDFIKGSSKEEIKKVFEEFRVKYPRTLYWFFEDELPRHTSNLGTFWIDKNEVANSDFANFLNSPEGEPIDKPRTWEGRTSPPGKQKHPVSSVDRFQAMAYCKAVGKRLSSESEWEKAARGSPGNIYPWGNQSAIKDVNTAELGMHNTSEVGSRKEDVSPYGVFDMGGNVMELVLGDLWPHQGYDAYPGNTAETSEAREAFEKRRGWSITRGGSYDTLIFDARGAGRRYFSPGHRGTDIGFRCTAD
jgi:formylglycine-generating enzyme required for sulfatase activity